MAMLFHKAMLADFDGCGQQRNEESTRNPSRVELFFQIDWRLGLLMDLQLASQTPLIEP